MTHPPANLVLADREKNITPNKNQTQAATSVADVVRLYSIPNSARAFALVFAAISSLDSGRSAHRLSSTFVK